MKLICNQKYTEGNLIKGEVNSNEISGSTIEVNFTLDSKILKESDYWNEVYIIREFLTYSFLHKNKSFNIITNNNTLNLKSEFGLKEMIGIESQNNFGPFSLETEIHKLNSKFEIEMAFAFSIYNKEHFLKKSFVNDYETRFHGSHVNGIIHGIKKTLITIHNHFNYSNIIKISKSKILKSLTLAVSIRLEDPIFEGATREKLGQKDLEQDIAKIVSDHLIPILKSDKDKAFNLLNSFDKEYWG